MKTRTFKEHLAHLERMSRELKIGVRVVVPLSGRTGVIVGLNKRHCGWLIEWDEPKFGVTRGRVPASSLDLVEEE